MLSFFWARAFVNHTQLALIFPSARGPNLFMFAAAMARYDNCLANDLWPR